MFVRTQEVDEELEGECLDFEAVPGHGEARAPGGVDQKDPPRKRVDSKCASSPQLQLQRARYYSVHITTYCNVLFNICTTFSQSTVHRIS